METYTNLVKLAAVTLDATTAAKICDLPRGIIGFRIFNNDAVDQLMLVLRKPGAPEPTAALMQAGDVDYYVPAQKTQDDGIRPSESGWQLWGLYTAAPTTGIVYPRLIKGPAR